MRAAIYARLSRDDDAACADARSCATQLAAGREAAQAQGWVIVEEITDENESGAEILQRPGLLRLRELARTGRIDVVVLRQLDRSARSQLWQGWLLGELLAHRVRIWEYARRDYVATSGVGYFITAAKAFAAEEERTRATTRTREKMQRLVDLGGMPASAPYGFRVGRRNGLPVFERCGEEIAIVERIGQLYADRGSFRAVARQLNVDGVSSPRGRSWHPTAIQRVLISPVYRGRFAFGRLRHDYSTGMRRRIAAPAGEVRVIDHPELRVWSDELLARIDERLAQPRRHWSGAATPKHLCSGYVRCGVCGRAVGVRTGRRPTYRCERQARQSNAACAGIGRRDERAVDEAVIGMIMPLLDGELAERTLAIIRERLGAEARGDTIEADRARARRALAKVERRVTNLTDTIADGAADVRPLVDALRRETHQRDELRDEIERLGRARPAQIEAARTIREAEQRLVDCAALLRGGGPAARPVLAAVLGGSAIRAVPVRHREGLRWHLSATVGSGWLTSGHRRHGRGRGCANPSPRCSDARWRAQGAARKWAGYWHTRALHLVSNFAQLDSVATRVERTVVLGNSGSYPDVEGLAADVAAARAGGHDCP